MWVKPLWLLLSLMKAPGQQCRGRAIPTVSCRIVASQLLFFEATKFWDGFNTATDAWNMLLDHPIWAEYLSDGAERCHYFPRSPVKQRRLRLKSVNSVKSDSQLHVSAYFFPGERTHDFHYTFSKESVIPKIKQYIIFEENIDLYSSKRSLTKVLCWHRKKGVINYANWNWGWFPQWRWYVFISLKFL